MKRRAWLAGIFGVASAPAQTRVREGQTNFQGIKSTGGPSRIYMTDGVAPVDTMNGPEAFAAVLFFEGGKLKVRKSDGTVVVIG